MMVSSAMLKVLCRERDVIVSLALAKERKSKNWYARIHTDGWQLVKIGQG